MSTEDPARLDTRERQVLWVSGYYRKEGIEPGSFYNLIIQAFFQADKDNKTRLTYAFPTTARALDNYMTGKLKEKYDLPD